MAADISCSLDWEGCLPLVRYCLDHLTSTERRALEQDLELAARLQRELLPRGDLTYDGWELAYHYKPLGPVSGDYCDVVTSEKAGKDLCQGDASGRVSRPRC